MEIKKDSKISGAAAVGITEYTNIGQKDVGIVVLAAGDSVRFHGPKLLERVGGCKLYQYIMETLQGLECPVVFVTQFAEIEEEAKKYGWYTVRNHTPELGISVSIKLGLKKLLHENERLRGILFCVCDQPFLKKETIIKMIHLFAETGKGIICSEVNEHPGNPNLFSREYFEEFSQLDGDVGGREIIRRHPEAIKLAPVSERKELMDIDEKKDLEKVKDME